MAVTFFVGAQLGTLLVFPGTNSGLFWPPAGVVLALMWIWGVRTWPGLALGALVQALVTLLPAHSLPVALGTAAGEVLADVVPVVLGVVWLRRALRGAEPLGTVRGVVALVLWGGIVAQAVSAALGAATLGLTGIVPAEALPHLALSWWLSNVLSVAVLAPACLAWRPPVRVQRPALHALAYGLVAAVALTVTKDVPVEWRGPLLFGTVLLVLGAAFDLGVRGATVVVVVLAGAAVGSMVTGQQLAGAMPLEQQVLFLDLYLATLAVTGLVVSAVLEERGRATRSHAEGEALLRSILEASPIPIAYSREDGRVEFWNARASELFGYRAEDIPTLVDWFERAYPDPAYRARLEEEWARKAAAHRQSGEDIVFPEVEVTCRDGRVVPVEVRARLAGGRILVIFTDLSDRRRADAQRAALQDELARAQRMETLGRLAGGIAHDLNNMLVPILSTASLLLTEAKGTPHEEDLAEIKASAERARALLRQLLSFAARQKLQLRVVDLREALAGLDLLLRHLLRPDVRLELKLPEEVAPVRADVGSLEQALVGLVMNAQQAMPQGGRVVIALEEGSGPEDGNGAPEGDWVRLSVSDTGLGMEPAVLDRAFDPFFTTRAHGEGSGLGLAMVHGIVAQHGGVVRAESAPGKGSTFHLYLPREDSAAERESEAG